ncbi:DUF4143 domain-containing protein [Metallosphaera javensis (ex Hofmann et al. 2022)]|uniref:DUF4143 domain-containing protein n=1 Tax=Metallosphaera javensis (ex Hofmann et al. 2022) TaxID=99938 RepID=UPI001EDD59D4|nr:hypothetical protein [Metallosphaera javensis (ex Hofmann et al. 2022)]
MSGSSILGVSKSPERFPGRKGNGREMVVLPLSFPEFAGVKSHARRDLLYDSAVLSRVFSGYMRHGGFPRSINSNPDASEALMDGVVSEIHKHRRNPGTVQDILHSLLGKIPSALSHNSIASDIGISHNTVAEYLDFLSDLLVIGIAYWKGERVDRKKEKKVFFRDPFLLNVISSWVGQNYGESALLENVVQEHLYRK